MTNDSRKALVLDLDETLVHSSFKEAERWDFTLDVSLIFLLTRLRFKILDLRSLYQ